MAAIRLDQARTGADGAVAGASEVQVIGRYLDMTMEVRCVRT
jgi:hypothetical protein